MPTTTSADALLAELEPLTHAERTRRMVALGEAARTDAEAAATLQGLAAGAFFERLLALLACPGSRDGEHVLRSLADESRLLRGLATRLAPAVCSDEQVGRALAQAPRERQADLLRGLVRARRRSAIDAFLDRLAADGDDRLGQLLAYGTAEAVGRHLEAALPRLGGTDWLRLARLHPDAALEVLTRQARADTSPDARLLWQANVVMGQLADTRPDGALALVRELLRLEPLGRVSLGTLAVRRPNEVADLLLASEDESAADLGDVAHRLTPDRLLALLERRPSALRGHLGWLRRLSPELRRAAYERAGRGWRSPGSGVLDVHTIELLPADLREAEARRSLALPALATSPANRLPYASFLPWEEARAVTDPFLRNPDADLRGSALSALIGAVRFQRERLDDVLALSLARKNEQDPVRGAMLRALAALPPSRWGVPHLEGLGRVVRDALDAADLSYGTAALAEQLVMSLVPFHPEWAARWIGTLVKERGQVQFRGLADRLSDADIRRIAPALLPTFEAWATREREGYLVQAATTLGRRLRAFDGLPEVLERVAVTTRTSYVAGGILALLREHRPKRFAELVPRLLAADASVVTLRPVYDHLHRRRQDLLTPFLGRKAYAGRFSTGKTRFVLPLDGGFFRWTPTQQGSFAETLTEVIRDAGRDTPAILQAVARLAEMPAVLPTTLFALAGLDAEKAAVRDAALQALARLDSGQGVPTLVEALGDDRARVAIYALRSAVREMPADRALALLRGAPTGKVTVAKEVVRLLGGLDVPDALPALLALDRPDLHRDVRVALLRALWDHTERDEAWAVLDAAAVDPDQAVAMGVVRIPADRLSPAAQGRLRNLLAALLGHPEPRVGLEALRRTADLPLADPGRVLLPRLLDGMASPLPDVRVAAARAVFVTYASVGEDAAAVGAAVGRIQEDRHALVTAVGALEASVAAARARLRPAVIAVLDALADDPLTAALRASLAVAGLAWVEIAGYLAALTARGEMHADALTAASQAVARQSSRPDAAAGLAALESALAPDADERLRRVALAALVAQGSGPVGWSPELRSRLVAFRGDPAPLVAAAAQFTLLPPEDGA